MFSSKLELKGSAKLKGAKLEPEPMDLEPNRNYDLEKLSTLPEISFLSIKESLKKKYYNFNRHTKKVRCKPLYFLPIFLIPET